jgi:hypothetical protein
MRSRRRPERDVKFVPVVPTATQPDIAGDVIEMQGAAIHNHRCLRRQPGGKRRRRKFVTPVGRQHAGADRLAGIKAGERIDQHRNAVARRDAERGDRGGEFRRRGGVKTAELDATARSDLDDAVAVRARRRAQACECLQRHRCAARRQPRQQPVAGRHRRAQPGTEAAAMWRVHDTASARSAAKFASISFRRGCQRPSRRAASNRSAIARAAAGFSRSRNARTCGSPR